MVDFMVHFIHNPLPDHPGWHTHTRADTHIQPLAGYTISSASWVRNCFLFV